MNDELEKLEYTVGKTRISTENRIHFDETYLGNPVKGKFYYDPGAERPLIDGAMESHALETMMDVLRV